MPIYPNICHVPIHWSHDPHGAVPLTLLLVLVQIAEPNNYGHVRRTYGEESLHLDELWTFLEGEIGNIGRNQ